MEIAGGIYREQCCHPHWDAVFGSGGRASLSLSKLTKNLTLHSYLEEHNERTRHSLRNQGISLRFQPRPTPIAFAYFHPLSTPAIQPVGIIQLPPLRISGSTVLRFGFLEGDAIVDAERAVYDPQSWRNTPFFTSNGSTSQTLAVVLNQLELQKSTGKQSLREAASSLFQSGNANLLVVKRGTYGVTVFQEDGTETWVPPYRSPRIFKIGTGDVFSAAFAYYWGELKFPPVKAADMASRSVAEYCANPQLPIDDNFIDSKLPVIPRSKPSVLLEGGIFTLGQRYAMEEAKFMLRELGSDVYCPPLGDIPPPDIGATLILGEGLTDHLLIAIDEAAEKEKPIILLMEDQSHLPNFTGRDITITSDFASSLYLSIWAAVENPTGIPPKL